MTSSRYTMRVAQRSAPIPTMPGSTVLRPICIRSIIRSSTEDISVHDAKNGIPNLTNEIRIWLEKNGWKGN